MENKKSSIFVLVFRIFILIVWLVSLIITLVLDYNIVLGGESAIMVYGNTFSMFTIQSNLLVALWLILSIIYFNKDKEPFVLSSPVRGAVTLYITVTFLIFAFILEPIYHPEGWMLATNVGLHYIVPIAFIIDWLVTETRKKYKWNYLPFWLIFPVVYLIYTLVRGHFTGFYPYPFLNLNNIDYSRFALNVVLLTALFLLLGSFYILVDRIVYKYRGK